MHKDKYVFSQLVSFLDRNKFKVQDDKERFKLNQPNLFNFEYRPDFNGTLVDSIDKLVVFLQLKKFYVVKNVFCR